MENETHMPNILRLLIYIMKSYTNNNMLLSGFKCIFKTHFQKLSFAT